MNIAKKGFILFGMVLTGACLSTISCAKNINWNWRDECVGRYQLSVPGDIEYPVAPYKDLISNPHPFYQFSDKVPAYFQEIYYNGEVRIGDGKNDVAFGNLKAKVSKNLLEYRNQQFEIKNDSVAKSVEEIPLQGSDAFAWKTDISVILYIKQNDYIFNWSNGGRDKDINGLITELHKFTRSFRLRPPYDVPATDGVCIPFAFIQDDGKPARDVSANLRPQSHPDVMITFEDNDYILDGSDLDSNEKAVIGKMFEYDSTPPHKSLAHIHPQTIDGRDGAAGFFHLTRPNGQKDFLYLAVIKGTGDDNPSLILRIERVAEYAKNQPPISEAEFKALAKRIVESIKKRPVSDSH